ncbi:hypothetical protein QLQ12_44870 [Actinoplanes sp. NEAU-A12]|uniref:Uncharacterized protein n=1 Tax=Actinoplanes sandaracinus TaxID=3045177 RepID=A0ABT6X145_9ACTN|nr:hypothetical protein [Actinoplanes sandaracinus]MDI6105734.1 hypothetical protein [Actinoplanes sandaracinus]
MTETLGTPAPDQAPSGRRPHPARVALAWLAGNLIIGYFVIMPLAVIDNLTYYVRAVRYNDVVAPYGPAGAKFAVAEIIFWTAVLLTASVLLNRRQWRRFRDARPYPPRMAAATVTAMIAGIAVVQLLPYLLFMTATDLTFPPLFPDAWS